MYFITCFQKYEIDEFGWPDLGAGRTFGYYFRKGDAVEAVINNNADIHEYTYRYAVIEHIPEGLYNVALDRLFFEWNEDAQRYDMIDGEPFEDCFGNYAFG